MPTRKSIEPRTFPISFALLMIKSELLQLSFKLHSRKRVLARLYLLSQLIHHADSVMNFSEGSKPDASAFWAFFKA